MKKIIDWTFGGIFRTIGRFIGFIIIGTIVGLILVKNDFEISDLLGFEKVYASTTENWATKEVKIYTCHDDTCAWSSNYTANHNFTGSDLDYPVHAIEWRVKATNGLSQENTYTFSFGYKATPDSLHPKTYFMRRNAQASKETITCQTSVDSNSYNMYKCTFTPNEDYSSSEWLYIQIQFYDSYLTGLNNKITAFQEQQGTNSVITQQTNEIIQQNAENTQEIINNIENASEVINNGLNNLQESQESCYLIDKNKVKEEHKYLFVNGAEYTTQGNFGITDYLNIYKAKVTINNLLSYNPAIALCYYTLNKELINCENLYQLETLTIPNNAYYLRSTIQYGENKPNLYICKNGNQALNESIHGVGEGIHDLNDSINSTDTTDSSNAFLDFMNNFNETDFGLASIITSPLTIITNLSSGTCSPITVGGGTGLFEGVSFELPCAMPFYEQWFGSFLDLYQMITFGIISYKILLDIFRMIHNFRNPNDDRIEVLDL